MNLNITIPEEYRGVLAAALAEDEVIRFSLKSDLTPDRHYGESYLVATDEHRLLARGRAGGYLLYPPRSALGRFRRPCLPRPRDAPRQQPVFVVARCASVSRTACLSDQH